MYQKWKALHNEFFDDGTLILGKQKEASVSFLRYVRQNASNDEIRNALRMMSIYDNGVIGIVQDNAPSVLGLGVIALVPNYLEPWWVRVIGNVFIGLVIMFGLKAFFKWLLQETELSERQFIIQVLQEATSRYGEDMVELSKGDFYLGKDYRRLFEGQSDWTSDYKYAYLINVETEERILHYCFFTNTNYNVMSDEIRNAFINVSAAYRDWSTHPPHLFKITKVVPF